MKFLSTILVLAGYTLVYAAVANHGRFYANPWMGIFRDAYGASDTTPTTPAKAAPVVPGTGPGGQGVFVRPRGAPAPSIGNGQPVGK